MQNLYQELGVKSVLLVGDDPWTRETLSVFLQLQGCRFQSSANANEALASVSRERYDLILCEDRLPEMDGLSFLKRCANDQPGAVRFLIAAYPHPLTAEDAVSSGIDDVIRKPFVVEALEVSLKRLSRQARGPGREEDSVS